jgi:ABC-type Fe3+/spermidine/putrescine transport system ATPase subunit
MSEIKLKHINHNYGSKQVLSDFSFDFEEEKNYCLLGPSGCGKTTILRLIAGLETPELGTVKIGEFTVSNGGEVLIPPHKREIGFVFQDLALWPHFTVYKNIAFGLEQQKDKNVKQKVREILDVFGIADQQEKFPHQLSGGQKQMVAIARSLVMNPKILLLDEPLANIDVHVKENIINHLYTLQKQKGFTMIYVTHDHREVLHEGNTIVVMSEGEVEASGSMEEIIKSENKFVKSFIKF